MKTKNKTLLLTLLATALFAFSASAQYKTGAEYNRNTDNPYAPGYDKDRQSGETYYHRKGKVCPYFKSMSACEKYCDKEIADGKSCSCVSSRFKVMPACYKEEEQTPLQLNKQPHGNYLNNLFYNTATSMLTKEQE